MIKGMEDRFEKSSLSKQNGVKIEIDFQNDHAQSSDSMVENLP